MKPRTSRLFLGALALALAAGASAIAQQQPKQAPQLRMAVVDINLLFKNYKRKDEFEQSINERREKIKQELDADQKAQIALRKEWNQYRENSEPWLRAREKLKMAQFALELKGERLQTELKNKVEQRTLLILNEIERTVADFGKDYGFDLILKIDKAEHAKGGGELVEHFQERIFRAQISDVLYFSGKLDITRNVLTVLNSKENLEKRAAESAELERAAALQQQAASSSSDTTSEESDASQPKKK